MVVLRATLVCTGKSYAVWFGPICPIAVARFIYFFSIFM